MQPPPSRHTLSWIVFLLSALTASGLFFIPALIIRPFRHQNAQALILAMELRERAPWGTLCAALLCLACAIVLWQAAGRWRKIFLAAVMVVVAFSAVMSRLNYFEWMFHPVESPRFEAESASKLDNGEMVLAITFGHDARAYPISEMAYHHILNDVVGGVPVAVTY